MTKQHAYIKKTEMLVDLLKTKDNEELEHAYLYKISAYGTVFNLNNDHVAATIAAVIGEAKGNTDMTEITEQQLYDITAQYMTDEEKYELEGLPTNRAVARFIRMFGLDRWEEISTA